MRNILLSSRTAQAIDHQVAKVIQGLGNPEPPINLLEVCDMLRLDRKFYASNDEGVLREVVHRMTVAGKQILARPSLILDVVRKLELKALYLPDKKRILVDSSLPQKKQRWNEAHEIGHSIIPWHEAFTNIGDNKQTLSPDCHTHIEAEANYGAGRLLFLQAQFDSAAGDIGCSIKAVQDLSKYFGNSMTTTLWRLVEWQQAPVVGLISAHPHYPEDAALKANLFRYFIRSEAFMKQFGSVSEQEVFEAMKSYCSYATRGPLGEGEVLLCDAWGREHLFQFETFHNSYEALTVGVYKYPHAISVTL